MRIRRIAARHLSRNMPLSRWQNITDPRKKRGRRHHLRHLLQQLLIALCVAAPTMRDAEDIAHDILNRRRFGLRKTPSDTTLERLIPNLCPGEFRRVLRQQNLEHWRAKMLPPIDSIGMNLIAVDGKCLGSDSVLLHPEAQPQGSGGKSGPYVLRAMRACLVSAASQPMLDQCIIPADAGEADTFPAFFSELEGAFGGLGLWECLSVDAGFTSRSNLHLMHEREVSFIAALKGNQPSLHAEVIGLLGKEEVVPPNGWDVVVTEQAGSRVVTRWFVRTSKVADWGGWKCLVQAWRIRQRTVYSSGQEGWEDRYYVTNLSWSRLSSRRCLRAVQLHWGVENGPNWTMDTQWGEDSHAWVRQGLGLEILGLIRGLAYNIVRLLRHRVLRSHRHHLLRWRRVFKVLELGLQMREECAESGFS